MKGMARQARTMVTRLQGAVPGFAGDERGVVAVLTALAMTVILGLAAVSVDAGLLYVAREQLKNASDAAALSGAQLLPEGREQAEAAAREYAGYNDIDAAEVRVDEGRRRVSVGAGRQRRTVYARIFSRREEQVGAESTALAGPISGVRGAVPFGVERGDFTYGELYALKLSSEGGGNDGGGDGTPYRGNFHALALGGEGAANYRRNVAGGYPEMLRAGDTVLTETGNMRGPTRQGVKERIAADPGATHEDFGRGSPRLIYVPVVDFCEVAGRKDITVIGFAAFFLEGYREGSDSVMGRFVRLVADGEVVEGAGAEYFGVTAVRLVK